MLVLLFLCVGIGITVVKDLMQDRQLQRSLQVDFSDASQKDLGAWSSAPTNNRESLIAALKAKIAAGEGIVGGGPVLTSVDEGTDEGEEGTDSRTLLRCANYEEEPSVLASWPQAGVTMSFVEGVRRVSVAEVSTETVGTSTEQKVSNRVLIDLPFTLQRRTSDTCIPSAVIGIASDGSLMHNNDAKRFSGYTESTLIGYALDGLPIFGVKNDTNDLDTCGGKVTATGYQYYVRPQEPFLIACFAGAPATFR